MQACVIGRNVATPSVHLIDLCHSRGNDTHMRADCPGVTFRTNQPEQDAMILIRRLIQKNGGWGAFKARVLKGRPIKISAADEMSTWNSALEWKYGLRFQATLGQTGTRAMMVRWLLIFAMSGFTTVAQDWLSVAQQAQRSHDFDRAAAAYSKLLDADPDNAKLLSNLGMMLQLAGKPEQALPPLLKALKLRPDMVAANLFAGLSLLSLGRAQDALPYLTRARDGDAKGALPLLGLAKAYVALGRIREANEYFASASLRDPSNAEIWAGLGATYGDLAKAVDAKLWRTNPASAVIDRARAAAGDPTTRAEMIATERALEKQPGDPALLVRLKRACLALSLSALRRAIELAPGSFENHSYLAATLAWANRQGEAVAEYEKAILIRPDSAQTHLDLAIAFLKDGNEEQALPALKKSLELDPDLALANAVMGDFLVVNGEAEKALPYLQRALRLDPGLAPAHVALAKAYQARDRLEPAVEEITKALPYDRDGSYYYLASQLYRGLGRTDEAAAALDHFLARKALQKDGSAH